MAKKTAKTAAKVPKPEEGEDYLFLNFIGRSVYTPLTFIEESAERHKDGTYKGIQRAIPFSQLKNPKIEFGEPILFAEYKPEKFGELVNPKAEVFGFSKIDGLSHNIDDEEVRKDIFVNIPIEQVSSGGGESESRECGSYGVAAIYVLGGRISLQEIVQAIDNACRKHGRDPMEWKYFLTGTPVNVFDFPVELSPCEFQRGFKRVFAPELKMATRANVKIDKKVKLLYDYNRRSYVSTFDRNGVQ